MCFRSVMSRAITENSAVGHESILERQSLGSLNDDTIFAKEMEF